MSFNGYINRGVLLLALVVVLVWLLLRDRGDSPVEPEAARLPEWFWGTQPDNIESVDFPSRVGR